MVQDQRGGHEKGRCDGVATADAFANLSHDQECAFTISKIASVPLASMCAHAGVSLADGCIEAAMDRLPTARLLLSKSPWCEGGACIRPLKTYPIRVTADDWLESDLNT